MKYRLTRQSKSFPIPGAKVFWTGTLTVLDLMGDKAAGASADQTLNSDLAHVGGSFDEMDGVMQFLNHNLGPNSPHWQVEEVA